MTLTALAAAAALLLSARLATPGSAQGRPPLTETILPEATLHLLCDEISRQLGYSNEVAMAGCNRFRTPEEMTGVMPIPWR